MLVVILFSLVGLVLLIKGADIFVDGAASFARNLRIPTAVIGLTVVAFGTSAPEMAISFSSHLSNNIDMLYGNVIGSSIANILVILGIAVFVVPFKVETAVIKKDIPIMLLVTLGLSVLLLDSLFDGSATNTLSRADGIILILFFSVFVFYLMTLLSHRKDNNTDDKKPKFKIPKSVVFVIFGLGSIIVGAELAVRNVAILAESIGISQKIISVTVISIGTSLPELATTVVAAKKGENNLAIGNIVGSNIFNICIVLGLPMALLGGTSTAAFGIVDVLFMIGAAVLLWIFAATNKTLKRTEGLILFAVYCVYCGYILMQ